MTHRVGYLLRLETLPPIDQATPRFSIDSSINLEAMAPVEQVKESPKAPTTEISANYEVSY